MRSLLVVTLLAAACLSLAAGELFRSASDKQRLFIYQRRIFVTHQLLETECPNYNTEKRELSAENTLPVHIEVAKSVYNELVEALIKCRRNKLEINKTTTPTTTTTTPTTTTTTPTTTTTTPTTTTTTPTTTTTTPTTTTKPLPKDCQQLYEQGERNNGVYEIDLPNSGLEPFKVWCDFVYSHGWTTFQKRVDGSVDFFRNWTDYKVGFGEPDSEYWLGNDRLHALTTTNQKLNIYVKAANGISKTGTWPKFYISDESDKYRLTISSSGYTGDLDKSRLDYHNGMMFSTKDQDSDVASTNCAVGFTGAWWYKDCYESNLNGEYSKNALGGVQWYFFFSFLVETTMKVTRD